MLNIFSYAFWLSVFLLWKNVCLDLLLIFQLGCLLLLLTCINYLYILDIRPLSVASFANNFFHSVGFLFIEEMFFMFSFAMQKHVSLIRFHLLIFVFISIALGNRPKKTLVQFMSDNFFPVFSSRSFMVSCLMFNSLRHFESIPVYDETLLIFMQLSNFPNTTCWRDFLFSIVYSCLPC